MSVVYFVGATNPKFTAAASLLAVCNTILEVVGYWAGRTPGWVSVGGPIVFGAIATICVFYV